MIFNSLQFANWLVSIDQATQAFSNTVCPLSLYIVINSSSLYVANSFAGPLRNVCYTVWPEPHTIQCIARCSAQYGYVVWVLWVTSWWLNADWGNAASLHSCTSCHKHVWATHMMGKRTADVELWRVTIYPLPALQLRPKTVNASKFLLISWVNIFKTSLQPPHNTTTVILTLC